MRSGARSNPDVPRRRLDAGVTQPASAIVLTYDQPPAFLLVRAASRLYVSPGPSPPRARSPRAASLIA